MKLRYYKRSTVISASRIIPYAKQIAGLSREAEDNETSRDLGRIPPKLKPDDSKSRGLIFYSISLKH